MSEYSAEIAAALAVLLDHQAEPHGQYRPDFRSEWWWCPACGDESSRAPYRDPGYPQVHQAERLAAAGLLCSTPPTPPTTPTGADQ